jgi:hypothetical protein
MIKKTQTLDQRPGLTRPEDCGGKYRSGLGRARAENLNSKTGSNTLNMNLNDTYRVLLVGLL